VPTDPTPSREMRPRPIDAPASNRSSSNVSVWKLIERLPRLAGWKRALEFLLTGDPFTPQRAYELGLVNRVVPHGDLLPAALELAGRIRSQKVSTSRASSSPAWCRPMTSAKRWMHGSSAARRSTRGDKSSRGNFIGQLFVSHAYLLCAQGKAPLKIAQLRRRLQSFHGIGGVLERIHLVFLCRHGENRINPPQLLKIRGPPSYQIATALPLRRSRCGFGLQA
jgi:hypothetical protein